MGQLFEFIGNHYILVVVFVALLFAFFINEGNQGGPKISTTSLVTLVNRDSALVIDVRETKDFNLGHIAGALNLSLIHISEPTRPERIGGWGGGV